jgi:hypothetical protein
MKLMPSTAAEKGGGEAEEEEDAPPLGFGFALLC